MSSMAARIDKLQSQYKNLGEKFEEAAKTYASMLKHPSIEAQFKSIANQSATFKHDLNEIRAAEPISLSKLVSMENEIRGLTQGLDSLRRSIGLPFLIDDQLSAINARSPFLHRGDAA
jgi:septation ring formation regulator EzrA